MRDIFPEPVRILSDVHWGHSVSLVRRPWQLAPLIDGAGTIVFNGDTIEERGRGEEARRADEVAVLEDLCRQSGAKAVFISGNHDPGVTGTGMLELAGGRVLVTHGDVLFPEIAFWMRHRPDLLSRCERLFRNKSGRASESLEAVISSVRSACAGVINERKCGVGIGFSRLLWRQAWPPSRPLHIVRCWAETGHRGERLADLQGNGTRFVIMGHTHYPGVWDRQGCVVINTGSFFPLIGGTVVDLESGALSVRRVVRNRDGFFRGPTVGGWRL
jgi:predicted phosphodiesterase